jgi:hypothetical protein
VRVGKSNYKYPDDGLSFHIAEDVLFECGYVAGLGTSHISAVDLMAASVPKEERTARDEARDFVREALRDGPLGLAEFKKLARESGISERSTERARGDLGVKAVAKRDGSGRVTEWIVELPPPRQASPPNPPSGGVGGVGGVDTYRTNTHAPSHQAAQSAQSAKEALVGDLGEPESFFMSEYF